MRATVTGATGFIGSYLVDRLLADGHHVTVLARRPESLPALRTRGVSVIRGDVLDLNALDSAMAGSDVVFHLARAKAHGTRPRTVFEVNADGTRQVVRAAVRAGVSTFVHAGSSSVYGARSGPVTETSALAPDSAYARSKAQGEEIVRHEAGDRMGHVIARITAVMGARCMSWLPLFRSAASGSLRLVGEGSTMHHPVAVTDVVESLMRCASIPAARGNVYNIAGPEPLSIADLRTVMARAAMKPGAVEKHPRSYPRALTDLYYHMGKASDRFLGLRPPLFESVSFLTADRVMDTTRAQRDLGYEPLVSVAEAARLTANWYREQGLL